MLGIHTWARKWVLGNAGHGCGKSSMVALVSKSCLENVVEEVVVGGWLEGRRVATLSWGCPELNECALVPSSDCRGADVDSC